MASKHRANTIRKYGLTVEEYDELVEAQRHKCKICNGGPSKRRGKQEDFYTFYVDHNHKTKEVRGLLCHQCNVLLGMANDNPIILLRAIQYLKGKL